MIGKMNDNIRGKLISEFVGLNLKINNMLMFCLKKVGKT